MRETRKPVKAFYHLHGINGNGDEIGIGMFYEDGKGGSDSCAGGGLTMKWYELMSHIAARLEVYDDGFESMNNEHRDFVQALKDREGINPQECNDLLKSLGYKEFS